MPRTEICLACERGEHSSCYARLSNRATCACSSCNSSRKPEQEEDDLVINDIARLTELLTNRPICSRLELYGLLALEVQRLGQKLL